MFRILHSLRNLRPAIVLVVLASVLPVIGQSDTIAFTFRGQATGVIGSSTFTDTPFTLQVLARTSQVQQPAGQPTTVFTVTGSSSEIDIANIGAATFLLPHRVFCAPALKGGSLGFGAMTADGRPGADLLDVSHSSLSNYDLKRAWGPLPNLPPDVAALSQFHDQDTSMGILTITQLGPIAFQAELIPEPSSFTLMIAAFALPLAIRNIVAASLRKK